MDIETDYTPENAADEIRKIAANLGITFATSAATAENRDGWECLSYTITAQRGARMISFDYHLGLGHIPRKAWLRVFDAYHFDDAFERAANKALGRGGSIDQADWLRICQCIAEQARVAPSPEEALATLAQDAMQAVETPFEVWAPDFGYDPDSRRAEKIWDALRDQYTNLRRVLSHEDVTALAELAAYL